MTPDRMDLSDALDDLERAVNALEGMEVLAMAGDGRGDMHIVQVDQFVGLLYIVRTAIEQRASSLRTLIATIN